VARLREQLHSFEQQHRNHGLLHISEVYDGDPPYRPGGAIAQSWSTAELIRAFAMLDGRIDGARAPPRRAASGTAEVSAATPTDAPAIDTESSRLAREEGGR
jgi:glycogen debranching enzyme